MSLWHRRRITHGFRSPCQDVAGEGTSDGDRMSYQGPNPSQDAQRVMEYAKLRQDRGPVIVDPLSCQSIVLVKRVDTAKRDFHPLAGARQTAPCPELCAADHHLEDNVL